MSASEVNRLFASIETYYGNHGTIHLGDKVKLLEEMKKFEGGEYYAEVMNDAFDAITPSCGMPFSIEIPMQLNSSKSEQSGQTQSRWKFDCALSVFNLFKFKCAIERIPVQTLPQQEQLPLQPLDMKVHTPVKQIEPQSHQQ